MTVVAMLLVFGRENVFKGIPGHFCPGSENGAIAI